VVGGSFQSVDRVRFLMEDVLRPLGGTTILEKHESPENFFLLIVELLQG